MWKKGHVRRNWTERWFVLKPASMAYYVSEDLKDKRGEIMLDKNCVVEVGEEMECKHCMYNEQSCKFCTLDMLKPGFRVTQTSNYEAGRSETCVVSFFQPIPDREGKRCMFCVKTHNKTFEMSASDQRQKVEWTQGVLVCINVDI